MDKMTVSRELLEFIDNSPSVFHGISNLKQMLNRQGFRELKEQDSWVLVQGQGYYVTRNDSSLLAFRLPQGELKYLHMAAAHSDAPCFKVKPCCEMTVEHQYVKLNTEKYGGMLMGSWLDRPLSVAGRAIVKRGDHLEKVLVNIDRDLLLIPNLAIHMNRSANEGCSWNAQKDLLPLYGGMDSAETFNIEIANAAGVSEEDLIDYDLFLYNRMPGRIWGAQNEFLSSRALDDLQCAFALMKGFLQAEESQVRREGLSICCIFDNEETGSLSAQGADSTFLTDILDRIRETMDISLGDWRRALSEGFMISADNAHAVHPNHPEMADPTNRPYLNQGIVIKYHANQKYTTDGVSGAMFRTICQRAGVPVQTFTNRSDKNGGSTLGNISNAHLSIRSVDIGLPQLAMHSSYETAGTDDTEYLIRAVREFFESHVEIF
ncbi:MAG: M18 family aminopeptidase [Lachnospiraceae bacterium]|nr:M18 family aminopeptidase [Lachnospiraceae bacterium]